MFVHSISRSRKEPRYSTDDLALLIYDAMIKDFQSVLPNFRLESVSPREGLSVYRDPANAYEYSSTSIYRFKAHAQMDALLKSTDFLTTSIQMWNSKHVRLMTSLNFKKKSHQSIGPKVRLCTLFCSGQEKLLVTSSVHMRTLRC